MSLYKDLYSKHVSNKNNVENRVSKELTKQTCQEWKKTDRTKNPLTNKQLNDRLKQIVLKRCNELLQDSSVSSSYSPDTLIKAAEKSVFKHRISPSKSASA